MSIKSLIDDKKDEEVKASKDSPTKQEVNEANFGDRPRSLSEIVGRDEIKKKLRIMIKSAKTRKDSIEHILFYGPPGLGKTTFGYAISNEMGKNFIFTSGPAINSKAEMASIIASLEEGSVLFIDEIHRLSKVIEEFLYPIMEDFRMDLGGANNGLSKIIRVNIPKFTLVGATTKFGNLSAPLRDRFGLTIRLEFYEPEDLAKIVLVYAQKWGYKIDDEASFEVARRSRGTARIAMNYLRRVIDYYISFGNGHTINFNDVVKAFNELEVDEYGIDTNLKKYIHVIYHNFESGPVGLNNISAVIYEDIRTIEEIYEPYLLKLGFIKRTGQGRILTEKGQEYAKNML